MNAADIVKALGGKNGRCNCPIEKHKTPFSLSVRDGTWGVLVKCHAGCSSLDVLRVLRRRGLLDDGEPDCPSKPGPIYYGKLDWLLNKLLPIEETPVAVYLGTRDLDLPPAGHHLRYLPAAPPKFIWPCMVGIISDFTDANRILSLHFTRLRPDGLGKAPLPKHEQRSYLKGFAKTGGVIRLCADADVERRLGVAEGIETSLSVMTAFNRTGSWYRPPVWAALDAGNMAGLPVVPGIDTLLIYADRGPAGEQAADTLTQTWTYSERDVFVAVAPVDDWNPAVAS
jgi:putative DNA primase/helicase